MPDATQRRHVLIDRHQQVQPADVVISGAHRRALANLLLDLDARLPRIRILQLPIHRRQIRQRDRRRRLAAEHVRKHRRARLRRRQAHVDLTQVREIRRVVGRQQRVGDRAQRHAIVEEAGVAADDRAA